VTSTTVLDLSRWQFAITAAFHMSFPAITVGLAIFLLAIYVVYMRTNDPVYLQIYRFWKKIFAVGFALGVVAGIVLTFEFGLNWGVYAHDVGPIVGVPASYLPGRRARSALREGAQPRSARRAAPGAAARVS
jgi:cytochrome bd ubiquinol oxidase subunit I